MVDIGNDWNELLKDEFEKDYYQQLRGFLQHEYKHNVIHPDADNIFNALKYTSYKDTKVVILGQDPYINYGEAHGLSFSVQAGAKIPPSLYNIFKELQDDLGCFIPNNGCLIPWAKQGVLLLNTVLTVRHKESNSHAGKGWEILTGRILELIAEKITPVVFLLWGRKAQERFQKVSNPDHMILRAVHPSPLAGNNFLGCKHFSGTNKFLSALGSEQDQIDWQIPNID